MEIEFNPNVTSGPSAVPANGAAGKSGAAAASQDTALLTNSAALKSAINSISPVRPEKVEAAQAAVTDAKFPPDSLLQAVASLIGEKIQ